MTRPAIKPIVKFGVLTDVQYADVDDKPAWYNPIKTRYYRSSLLHIRQAFESWVSMAEQPSFALQLGDLIDGLNRNSPNPLQVLRKALEQFDSSGPPVFHVVGNHELYNFKRNHLVSLLRESLTTAIGPHHDDRHLYYSFSPVPGVKIIALDCFEVSTIGYDAEDEHYKQAADVLAHYHGHQDSLRWDENGDLEGLELRFQEQNGSLSSRQLTWLAKELNDSDHKQEKVFVFGHCCIEPMTCDPTCLLWNYDDVQSLFSRHPCVTAYLSGHAHNAGHYTADNGIHYLVFHGIIETSPDSKAFATLSLFDDRLEVDGRGTEETLILPVIDRYALVSCSPELRGHETAENAIEGEGTPVVEVIN